MMGKQGRMGSFSNNKSTSQGGKGGGAKKKMVIKPFKVLNRVVILISWAELFSVPLIFLGHPWDPRLLIFLTRPGWQNQTEYLVCHLTLFSKYTVMVFNLLIDLNTGIIREPSMAIILQ